MRQILLTVALTFGLSGAALAACPVPPRGQPLPAEAVSSQQVWPPWRAGVASMTDRLQRSNVSPARMVFLGDSITEGWQAQIFQQFYGHRTAINLGIGGDATQGMLWRLGNGHWPAGLRPQLIVLMIGTNNIGYDATAENTAIAIGAVVAKLQQLSPNSRILLLGLLPRGATAADPLRGLVEQTNRLIAPCADGRRVVFANPGPMLLDGAGNLADYVSFDGLHLTMVGYAILSAAIEPAVRQLLP
ncbi:GDSL-type esterase/lipase family protein [Roseococcus sp.]|uniref:GDSL-type esterase/lipase family protein n=1 Tax=Roseococcus sp. TaxID=2109646 RepID=UPI003BAB3749